MSPNGHDRVQGVPPPWLAHLARQSDLTPLLAALLERFHQMGWVSGTGGGICGGPPGGDTLWIAPTGVHKEMIDHPDFFTVRIADGRVVSGPDHLAPSECTPIFCAIAKRTGARGILHSHALSAVIVADLRANGAVPISGFEMLKGLGISNRETHLVPVLENTEHEATLTDAIDAAIADPRFAGTRAVLVADHGAYIWGADVMEAKKHAEVYHWLFEGVLARAKTDRGGRDG